MATLLAVEQSGTSLSLVKAELAKGDLTLRDARIIELTSADGSTDTEAALTAAIRDFVGKEEIDTALAVVDSAHVVSHTISLPFRDQKRIDQTAPIQLEDQLPFDVNEYIVDSFVVERSDNGLYQILTTLSPRADVMRLIASLKASGVEPHVLTTRASALTALLSRFSAEITATSYPLIGFHRDGCSCAVIEEGAVRDLRDVLLPSTRPDFREALRDVQLLLLREENRRGSAYEQVVVVGVEDSAIPVLTEIFGRPVQRLNLDDVIKSNTGQDLQKIPTAVALFAGYEDRAPLINFRKGELAYKATWNQLRTAVQEHSGFFIWGIVLLAAWYGAGLYSNQRIMARLDSEIEEKMRQAMPADAGVPEGQELNVVRAKVEDLEKQLEGMGTLSALSPLELLRSLSETVTSQLDVAIESINISSKGFTFSGTVSENVMIGRLQGTLEKQQGKFCAVKVDQRGRAPGTNRIRFLADIELCGKE